MRDSMGQHAGLARAGPRNDEERSVLMEDRIFLGVVQTFKELSRHCFAPYRMEAIEPAFCSDVTGLTRYKFSDNGMRPANLRSLPIHRQFVCCFDDTQADVCLESVDVFVGLKIS